MPAPGTGRCEIALAGASTARVGRHNQLLDERDGQAALVALALADACQTTLAHSVPAQPPEGEVWLTEQQVQEAKLRIEPIASRVVGNEVVTSGKIPFDDLTVG